MKNRLQRRSEKSAFIKQLKGAVFNSFENITSQALSSAVQFPSRLGKLIGFYKNDIYSVQVYERNGIKILGIRRHDQKASCPWKHKQAIKNHILGDDAYAIEVFPSIEDLTDAENMYWLWSSENITKLSKLLGGIS